MPSSDGGIARAQRFCQQSVLLGEPHQGLSHANDGARLDAGAQRKATRREYEDG